jgi:hypothetical protein
MMPPSDLLDRNPKLSFPRFPSCQNQQTGYRPSAAERLVPSVEIVRLNQLESGSAELSWAVCHWRWHTAGSGNARRIEVAD